MKKKMTFALCFCNRGFMPGELIYGARDDMVKAVTDAGYDYIMMDKELTRYGGVETRDEGRIKPMPITISNCQTKDGKIVIYASEAKFTDDPIEDGYFGCGGVAEIPHLQDKCITLAKGGFKHHTAICEGHYKDILKEAFTTYLGYEWVDIDG